jgi:hypothetical protein
MIISLKLSCIPITSINFYNYLNKLNMNYKSVTVILGTNTSDLPLVSYVIWLANNLQQEMLSY